MRKGKKIIEKTIAMKSNARERRYILENSLSPLILTDGKERFWDGSTLVRWKEERSTVFSIHAPTSRREIRMMTRDGAFPEAHGAFMNSSMWWRLRDSIDSVYRGSHSIGDAAVVGQDGAPIPGWDPWGECRKAQQKRDGWPRA